VSRLRRRRQGETFGVPLAKTEKKGPEVLPWWWHPDNPQAGRAPQAVVDRLRAINPDLGITFSKVHERFIVWHRKPENRNPICPGWGLLFLWETGDTHEFLHPEDPRLIAQLFLIDRNRYGRAEDYFNQVMGEIRAKREAREKAVADLNADEQQALASMTTISTAAKGNRFSQFHSGTVIDSPSQAAERQRTAKFRLPPEMVKRQEADKEKAFYS
jgi:hypothetical protein